MRGLVREKEQAEQQGDREKLKNVCHLGDKKNTTDKTKTEGRKKVKKLILAECWRLEAKDE